MQIKFCTYDRGAPPGRRTAQASITRRGRQARIGDAWGTAAAIFPIPSAMRERLITE